MNVDSLKHGVGAASISDVFEMTSSIVFLLHASFGFGKVVIGRTISQHSTTQGYWFVNACSWADYIIAINSYQGIYDNGGVNANTFLESNLNGQKSTITSQAGEMFSDRQSPLNMPSLAGSASASPISPASRTPSVNQPGFLGVHAPISELVCSDMPGKPCYGENGSVGFSVRRGSGSEKDRYWLNPTMAPFAPIHEQACTGMGEPIYECPKVGLGSFQAMQDPCSTLDTFMESINETPCTKAGEAIEFPTWDQLPAEFQNPTTSAGYVSAIPFSTTGASRANVLEGGMGNAQSMRWDDSELMDFDMDLDVDMDLGTVGQPF